MNELHDKRSITTPPERIQKNWKFKTGLTFIIISIVLFLSLPIIPFLQTDPKTKITLSLVTLIAAEVLFYSGGFLLGRELFIRYKSYLSPARWFRNKNKIKTDRESENG